MCRSATLRERRLPPTGLAAWAFAAIVTRPPGVWARASKHRSAISKRIELPRRTEALRITGSADVVCMCVEVLGEGVLDSSRCGVAAAVDVDNGGDA